MKKIIIILVVVLVVLIGVGGFLATTSFDAYEVQEKVNYTEVFDSSTPTIYYYYKPDCTHCHAIKPQVNRFVQQVNNVSGLDFKLVDMSDSNNKGGYGDTNYAANIAEMNINQEVKVRGTPGAAYIADGTVQAYGIGGKVFDVFEQAASEYGISTSFDRDAI